MSDSIEKARFDIVFFENHVSIDYHLCREWDEDGGCYGTNPNHGLSFEVACDEVADWYAGQADLWRKREHHLCLAILADNDRSDA